jgi:hypothetical protein
MLSTAASTVALHERKQAALMGMFIGDALAMPVHWYYDVKNIQRAYGQIKGYTKPDEEMHGGYMGKIAIGGGSLGRAGFDGKVIGAVINHGKDIYFDPNMKYSYHPTLHAGEETLEASIARVLIRTLTKDAGRYNSKSFLDAYVKFMTTPGSHNDSFASAHHRHFWGNYAAGIAPEECAEASDKVHDASDAFTFPIPILIAELGSDAEAAKKDALSVNKLFRKSDTLDKWVDHYLVMLT